MPDARIRTAQADDAAAIERVRFESWQVAYADQMPASAFAEFDVSAGAARLAERLTAGTVRAHVADVDGRVVGFASYGRCRDDDLPGASEVYAIYVLPEFWSAGIGRSLLAAAVADLPDRNAALWVLRENTRARRFYERSGWSADGAEKAAQLLGGVTTPEIRYRLH